MAEGWLLIPLGVAEPADWVEKGALEVLISSELGIDKVTGSTVERTEVVGGGGVKMVA